MSKSLVFLVERCHESNRDENDPDCAPEDEIDDKIRGLRFQGFTMTHKVNFDLYKQKPVYAQYEHISTGLVLPDFYDNHYV